MILDKRCLQFVQLLLFVWTQEISGSGIDESFVLVRIYDPFGILQWISKKIGKSLSTSLIVIATESTSLMWSSHDSSLGNRIPVNVLSKKVAQTHKWLILWPSNFKVKIRRSYHVTSTVFLPRCTSALTPRYLGHTFTRALNVELPQTPPRHLGRECLCANKNVNRYRCTMYISSLVSFLQAIPEELWVPGRLDTWQRNFRSETFPGNVCSQCNRYDLHDIHDYSVVSDLPVLPYIFCSFSYFFGFQTHARLKRGEGIGARGTIREWQCNIPT